jgi:hypothetical protein
MDFIPAKEWKAAGVSFALSILQHSTLFTTLHKAVQTTGMMYILYEWW